MNENKFVVVKSEGHENSGTVIDHLEDGRFRVQRIDQQYPERLFETRTEALRYCDSAYYSY